MILQKFLGYTIAVIVLAFFGALVTRPPQEGQDDSSDWGE